MYLSVLKPIFDKAAALVLLLIAMPVILVCMIALAVANSGKVWFIQRRPGKDERIFSLVKFKTMTDQRDENGNLLPDAERMTRVGSFIRKTSLDELPQLVNVLKGDMSLVGPRPLLVEYLKLYNGFQARRHEVVPGITGWAQVNGRNAISWERKFELDVWYVDHVSFLLDVKILFLTLKKVFISEGISSPTHVTMEKFSGNKNIGDA